MERGYLVAALAITMTFAGLSRGFHSLEQISFLRFHHFGAAARAHCPANAAADLASKMKMRLHPRTPEEAQMRAESVPIAVQSSLDEQMSRQEAAISRCVREKALRKAEREIMRSQRIMERYQYSYMQPMAIQVSLSPEVTTRIQETAARLASSNVAVQVAAARVRFAERTMRVLPPRVSCPHNNALPPDPPAAPDDGDSN